MGTIKGFLFRPRIVCAGEFDENEAAFRKEMQRPDADLLLSPGIRFSHTSWYATSYAEIPLWRVYAGHGERKHGDVFAEPSWEQWKA